MALSPPTTPKKKGKAAAASNAGASPNSDTSPSSSSTSSPRKAPERLSAATKKAIEALKLRGMSTKEIATKLDKNYKTVWGHVDKITKQGAKLGANVKPEEMSDADKRQAATSMKMAGMGTKEIATALDMNYKTLWGFFNQQQKASGLPDIIEDPDA